jgi:hypothetical protein
MYAQNFARGWGADMATRHAPRRLPTLAPRPGPAAPASTRRDYRSRPRWAITRGAGGGSKIPGVPTTGRLLERGRGPRRRGSGRSAVEQGHPPGSYPAHGQAGDLRRRRPSRWQPGDPRQRIANALQPDHNRSPAEAEPGVCRRRGTRAGWSKAARSRNPQPNPRPSGR